MVNSRIKQLQGQLTAPLLVVNPKDIAYLTAHNRLSSSFLLITNKQLVLFGGSLEKLPGVKKDLFVNLQMYLGRNKNLLVDDHISSSQLKLIKKRASNIKLQTIVSPVDQLRVVKDKQELKEMKVAYQITIKVFKEVKKYLNKNKNITEKQLAKFIHITGLKFGADDISFPVIVASGTNAAIPHHVPTTKKLKSGESIILDFGFKYNGYCSDFTRTIFLNKISRPLEQMYIATKEAYDLAVHSTKAGVKAYHIDKIARDRLATSKLEKYFIHSLGHGTGLDIHEPPYLHSKSKDILQNGMVFSIEPGVYKSKIGGVRIEDLVYLKNGKLNYFQKHSTELKDMVI